MILLFSQIPILIPFFFFFFNDTATTEIYTHSLHDALPIFYGWTTSEAKGRTLSELFHPEGSPKFDQARSKALEHGERSEEHTSELQSQSNLVCRLLLEKKKKTQSHTRDRSEHKTRNMARRV